MNSHPRHDVWTKQIIAINWMIIAVYEIGNAVGLLITYLKEPENLMHDLYHYTLVPTVFLLIVMIVSTLIIKRFRKYTDYILLIMGSLNLSILVHLIPDINGIQLILFVPILFSAFYFEKRKVIFSFFLNLASFVVLYRTTPFLYETLTEHEILLTIAVYIGCTITAIGILRKGKDLLNHLRETMQMQQDLMIKNTLIVHSSKTDALTNLYNHKTFHEYMDMLFERAEQSGIPLQLAIADIDNFKNVNDRFGHWTGDIVLKEVGARLKECTDQDDFVSRYGGEEFSIIFLGKTEEEAIEMLEKAREKVHQINLPELQGHEVTISIGLHSFKKGQTKKELFEHADDCLYKAKHSGKNKVIWN